MLEERFQNCLISVMSNDHDQAEDNFSVLATTGTTTLPVVAQLSIPGNFSVFRHRASKITRPRWFNVSRDSIREPLGLACWKGQVSRASMGENRSKDPYFLKHQGRIPLLTSLVNPFSFWSLIRPQAYKEGGRVGHLSTWYPSIHAVIPPKGKIGVQINHVLFYPRQ